jgi:hypothetical protein
MPVPARVTPALIACIVSFSLPVTRPAAAERHYRATPTAFNHDSGSPPLLDVAQLCAV